MPSSCISRRTTGSRTPSSGWPPSFGCKAAYLLRLYRQVKGSTPTQDLIRLRIEKAKRLLVGHPQLEIKQVAAAVGYEDALYFSRLFKKETGMNPSAFRDSMGRP